MDIYVKPTDEECDIVIRLYRVLCNFEIAPRWCTAQEVIVVLRQCEHD